MKTLSELAYLGAHRDGIAETLAGMKEARMLARIWDRDHTVWRPEPEEITNRLGWLDIAERVGADLRRFQALRDTLLDEGYTDVLLLGMGGSSLAPDLFGTVFADEDPALQLEVLDSTDPGAVLEHARRLDLRRTLFIVASKSGTTAETISFFKFFYNRTRDALGGPEAGAHFVAITDPGSALTVQGERLGFREVFVNDPHIGGRYSVFSYFGMVPATLAGVDVESLLARGQTMMEACGPEIPLEENPAAFLGAVLGTLANVGRDKLTLVLSPEVAAFGDWVEQLIAESTGKDGQGILPVVGEPLMRPEYYGEDRYFVYLGLEGDTAYEAHLALLKEAGLPVVHIPISDRYDLGGQFFLWELATAVAGAIMDIQPFNQPNVESAKKRAKEMIAAYEAEGKLPPAEYAPLDPDALIEFLAQARSLAEEHPCGPETGDYIALQAFVEPTAGAASALQKLRIRLLERYHRATTTGFGPRYLHSTGQLHKGDAGHGLFIQLVSQAEEDAPIPDEPLSDTSSITFDVLKQAQAQGDYQALLDAGRRAIRFFVGGDVISAVETLMEGLT